MMLVIETQCYENYAWQEDGSIGVGQEAYWKAKGGQAYKILGVPTNIDLDEVVSLVRSDIERANDYVIETIIGYGLEADDWLSPFEANQLEYEGSIEFSEPCIDYREICGAN